MAFHSELTTLIQVVIVQQEIEFVKMNKTSNLFLSIKSLDLYTI